MELLPLPATRRIARAVYWASIIDEQKLSDRLELSRNTVRLTLAALQQVGALTMSRSRNGVRELTIHPEAPYWAGIDGLK